MQETRPDRHSRLRSWISEWSSPSVYTCLLLLATCFFYWDGVDLLTPFLFPLIGMAVWGLFICVGIGALIKACSTKNQAFFQRFRFVILDLVVALLAIFLPITDMKNTFDFNFNFNKRMEIVEMAKNGKLSRPHDYNKTVCALPAGFEYLSKGGGEVIVTDATNNDTGKIDPSTIHVLFYTFRGVLAHYSGFEYAADGKPPSDAKEAADIVPLRKNWYWVAY